MLPKAVRRFFSPQRVQRQNVDTEEDMQLRLDYVQRRQAWQDEEGYIIEAERVRAANAIIATKQTTVNNALAATKESLSEKQWPALASIHTEYINNIGFFLMDGWTVNREEQRTMAEHDPNLAMQFVIITKSVTNNISVHIPLPYIPNTVGVAAETPGAKNFMVFLPLRGLEAFARTDFSQSPDWAKNAVWSRLWDYLMWFKDAAYWGRVWKGGIYFTVLDTNYTQLFHRTETFRWQMNKSIIPDAYLQKIAKQTLSPESGIGMEPLLYQDEMLLESGLARLKVARGYADFREDLANRIKSLKDEKDKTPKAEDEPKPSWL